MFNVGNTLYGTILYNTRTGGVGILRQQKIRNPVQPERANRVHHLWVSVVNLIEDGTWAELWAYRDDQTPITDFTDWIIAPKHQGVCNAEICLHMAELGKFYAWQGMMETSGEWFINVIDDDVVEEFYMQLPRDMWDATKIIIGNKNV